MGLQQTTEPNQTSPRLNSGLDYARCTGRIAEVQGFKV